MNKPSAALILFLLLSSLPTGAVAQTQTVLEKGTRVRVTAMEGRTFTRLKSSDPQSPREWRNWVAGPVWSWNDSVLTLEAAGQGPNWILPFASIEKLELSVGRSRGTAKGFVYWGLIGAGSFGSPSPSPPGAYSGRWHQLWPVSVPTLRLCPLYDPLRDHPRFQALVEK